MEAGVQVAIAEFGPSYRRAAVLQASLAIVGTLAAALAWSGGGGGLVLVAAVLLFSVVPFTLVVVFPTNKELLDPALDASSGRAKELLDRWANLHAVRTVLGFASFVLLVIEA